MSSPFAFVAQQPAGLPPDLVLSFVVLDVALILVAARTLGAIFRRWGQPMVVGEIVAGVLLGPTLLGPTVFHWTNPPAFLHCDASLAASVSPSITSCLFPPQARSVIGVLGQIALIVFMFLVGLEFDLDAVKGKVRGIVTVALSVIAVPLVLGAAITPVLYNDTFVAAFGTSDQPSRTAFALMVGAMLAVTAFPVMARILQEKGLTQSAMGATGIAAAALVTILMFLTISVALGVTREASAGSIAARFVGTAVFIAVLGLVVRPALRGLGRAYERSSKLTPEMLAGLLVLAFGCAFVADRIGINVIVGAFLAGLVVPAPRRALFEEMASRLVEVTAVVLLPLFLAFSGLSTDFTKLSASAMGGITLFLVAGVAAKWLAGAAGARLGGLSWSEGNVLGILMNCRGLLVLVVGLLAMEAGVITAALQVGGVLMALLTTAMTGPLFDHYIGRVATTADS